MPATLQSPGQQQPLDDTMGVMLLGTILSAILFGASTLQVVFYFRKYRDSWPLRILVVTVTSLDFIHLIMITHTVYYYTITKYYHPEAMQFMVWSVLIEALFTGVTGALVQLFYAWRVYLMSNKNPFLTSIILLLVIANAGCGTAWVVLSLRMKTFQELLSITPLTITINALSACADVLISASLVIMLRKSRTGFKQTDTMIAKLVLFLINTGLVTSICAIASLVALAVRPQTLVYALFYFCIGRLYCNSLLAALNARKSLRNTSGGNDERSHPMVSMPPSVVSPTGTGPFDPRKISIRVDTTQEFDSDHKSPISGLSPSDISSPVSRSNSMRSPNVL